MRRRAARSHKPHPGANHRKDLLTEERGECHSELFDLNLNFKTSPSLHFLLSNQLFMKSTNEQRVLGRRANTWTALNLIHCFSFITSERTSPCLVYKCLLRTLRDDGGGAGGGGMFDRREGCRGQRGGYGSRSRRGCGERGGRWREMRSGALGKGRRMERRRREAQTQRGRKTEGKTEGKMSQSSRDNRRRLRSIMCVQRLIGALGPWVSSKYRNLTEQDIVLK